MNKLIQNNRVHPQEVDIPAPLEIHPSVSPLAAELLMKTADLISKSPDQYDQSNPRHNCGSPCCIIGHMEALVGVETYAGCVDTYSLIGLKPGQYEAIFHEVDWPEKVRPRGPTTAAQGIARIEHFLRTGE